MYRWWWWSFSVCQWRQLLFSSTVLWFMRAALIMKQLSRRWMKGGGVLRTWWSREPITEKPRSFIPKRDYSWAYGNIHQLLITETLTRREIMEKWYAGCNLPSLAVITPWKQQLPSQEQAAETDSYQPGDLDLLRARFAIHNVVGSSCIKSETELEEFD